MLHSPLTPLVIGVAYIAMTAVRSAWLMRSAGVSGYVIDSGDALHRFVGRVFVAIVAALLLYFGTVALWPQSETHFGALTWFVSDATRWVGLALMVAALVCTTYAQFSMGNSWRIGVPNGETLALRTAGPFALSRNPIFLSMLCFLAGMTIWSPSAITMALLVATFLAIEVQIRIEEAYLERTHGEAYRAFCKRVRRWI